MVTSVVGYLVGLILLVLVSAHSHSYPYDPSSFEERWFDGVPIDHYNFRPVTPHNTFSLRYFINTDCYNPNNGSVLFYAGNEAPIEMFLDNCGFLLEAACTSTLGAAVIFAEHRYYGKSMPFGPEESLSAPDNISYLTVEQAMQDFNLLNVHLGKELRKLGSSRTSTNSTSHTRPPTYQQPIPIIVAGGSYGGNLALWLRLKNPNLWAGALASSATPLKHLLRESNAFTRIETQVYANVSAAVPDLIRQGWKDLFRGVEQEPERVQHALGLCAADSTTTLSVLASAENLHGWIAGALETMVQYGYPYPTNVYQPVPGYPFAVAVDRMLRGDSESDGYLTSLRAVADVFYNFTGQAGACYGAGLVLRHARRHWHRSGQLDRVYRQSVLLRDRGGSSTEQERLLYRNNHDDDDDDAKLMHAWGYQTCTEVYQPMPTNGITDFELPYTPNATEYYLHCQETYGVTPRPDWEEMTFMGDYIGAGSNIFLTNGQLDPWRAAGISAPQPSTSISVRTVEQGAHHYDLRPSHDLDPLSVTVIRKEILVEMQRWKREWKTNREQTGSLPKAG